MTEPVPETRPPDVVVQPVEPDQELQHRNNVLGVALLDPGSTVTLEAWRDGERRDVRIKLGDRPLSGLSDAG